VAAETVAASEGPAAEDRAPQCTTLVYVDDATSRLMVVLFCGSESTFGYFEATRKYIHRYGKPLAFYSDKASIFRVNHKTATNGKGHTQFARALFELNIEGLCANTAGAKGRVERHHLTLQDRLVKELRLQGIHTVDAANEFMPSFIEDYNRRFGKLPRDRHDAHRPVREDEDLDLIFSWHEARKVTSNLTLQYERKIYMLADNSENRRLIGKYIDVLQFPDGRVDIRVGGQSLPYSTYDRVGVVDQGSVVNHKRLSHALQAAQILQAQRDGRVVNKPSTAHRSDGIKVPRKKVHGTRSQRELGYDDLHAAIQALSSSKTSIDEVA
jgi:hypothetical protein